MPQVAIAELSNVDGIGREESKLVINAGKSSFTRYPFCEWKEIFKGKSNAESSYRGSSSRTYERSSSSSSLHDLDEDSESDDSSEGVSIEKVEKGFQGSGDYSDYRKAEQHLLALVESRDYVIGYANQVQGAYYPKGLNYFSISDEIPGDGNCQFRAVALLFWQDQNDHRSLRRTVVEYMRANPESFRPYITEGWETYLREMAEDGTWGDHYTLTAMAALYQRRFVVVSERSSGVSVTHVYREEDEDSSKSGTYFLSLRGDHYEVFVPGYDGNSD
ncbi:uncharacterized protein MELLADRAFT_92040 [Melampsora larici-populina 98AG31]|uniref:OTU domain-containing protein n=1 Tax=Melampsora larici-populina (strain 98AG31 / pathotype 3-4-7) TaxID=747676 RepID=F4S1B1_MELLP|nr:uncharacterized protein MELLADRAFT_92040 [Melampsora larici-populina 98AG31]EGG01531.1 hypothetical protein MELLADRAFT_92040 [Melampsora larici-populina 98AG31]